MAQVKDPLTAEQTAENARERPPGRRIVIDDRPSAQGTSMPIKKGVIRSTLLLAALSCAGFHASANDSSFGDDNGTIKFKKQTDISMDKEVLVISQRLVEVDYVFTNNGQADLAVPVAFPMPPMYFGQADHDEMADFRLKVNGKAVKTSKKLVVMLDGKTDISARFAALGWSPAALQSFMESRNQPSGTKPLPSEWFDKHQEPRFTLSDYFVWTQVFPVGKSVAIHHSYRPSVSSGVPQPSNHIIDEYAKSTCMEKDVLAMVTRRGRAHDDFHGVAWAHLSYILMTANNWQGPIKDFTLKITKQTPSDVVSLCFDGDLKKVDPMTFQFRQKDYRPRRDLSILFIKKRD